MTDQQTVARARAAVERRAWDAAADAFAAADAHAPLDAEDLEAWATAAYLLGQVDAAIDARARAFDARRAAGDPSAAVRCGFWLVFILLNRGDLAQAGGWLTRCERLLDESPGATTNAYLRCLRAFRLVAVDREYGPGRTVAREVADAGRRTGDDDLVALGLTIAGRAAILDQRTAEGLRDLDEAMASVVTGTLSPLVAGTVYCSLIEACEQIGELRRAREWTTALTRWCDRQDGMVTFTGQCLTHRATILRRCGQWRQAHEQATLARTRFEGAADDAATGMAWYELAEVHRVRGDLDAAEDAYLAAGEWGHDPQPGLALVRLAQGRVDAAVAALRRLLVERTDSVDRVALLPAAVEVLLAAGETAAARAAADELAGHAATFATEALRAKADEASGAVQLAVGDPAAAAATLRRALEAWRTLEAPYDAARVRVRLGDACDRAGDRDTAAVERAAARRTFTQLGATADLAALDANADGPDHGLTPREVEVLQLVATGMTNQAIADDLCVARKTVDRHVGNILAKLGVPSRTAATAYAYEHDLLRR